MNDTQLRKLDPGPELIIFDIDETLLKPNSYKSIDAISQGLYDNTLLREILTDKRYQVAIASFNTDIGPQTIGGGRLARAILDINLGGDSSFSVPDDFIEAWVFRTYPEIFEYRKNVHINRILQAYVNKYGKKPPVTYFYDDQIENVYSANKNGIVGFWCNTGVTSQNLRNFIRLGTIVRFTTFGILENWFNSALKEFASILRRQPVVTDNGLNVYNIYLPQHKKFAQTWWYSFVEMLKKCKVNFTVVYSD